MENPSIWNLRPPRIRVIRTAVCFFPISRWQRKRYSKRFLVRAFPQLELMLIIRQASHAIRDGNLHLFCVCLSHRFCPLSVFFALLLLTLIAKCLKNRTYFPPSNVCPTVQRILAHISAGGRHFTPYRIVVPFVIQSGHKSSYTWPYIWLKTKWIKIVHNTWDENPVHLISLQKIWFLIGVTTWPLDKILIGFWWESENNSDEILERTLMSILMRILRGLKWETWEDSNNYPGRILMRIFKIQKKNMRDFWWKLWEDPARSESVTKCMCKFYAVLENSFVFLHNTAYTVICTLSICSLLTLILSLP